MSAQRDPEMERRLAAMREKYGGPGVTVALGLIDGSKQARKVHVQSESASNSVIREIATRGLKAYADITPDADLVSYILENTRIKAREELRQMWGTLRSLESEADSVARGTLKKYHDLLGRARALKRQGLVDEDMASALVERIRGILEKILFDHMTVIEDVAAARGYWSDPAFHRAEALIGQVYNEVAGTGAVGRQIVSVAADRLANEVNPFLLAYTDPRPGRDSLEDTHEAIATYRRDRAMTICEDVAPTLADHHSTAEPLPPLTEDEEY